MSIIKGLLFGRNEKTGSPSTTFRTTKSGAGFTLVELLVVIAIISILATLLLLQLGVARAKARDAKRIADVNQVRSALELFFDDNGRYLNNNDAATIGSLKPAYLINIPRDPIAPGCTDAYVGTVAGAFNCYGYAWTGTATTPARMQIWAELEQRNVNALNNDTDINSTGWSGAVMVGATEACVNTTPSDCIYDSGQP